MDCPDDNTLAAMLEHELAKDELDALHVHLDSCEKCRTVAALALGSNETLAAGKQIERDPEGLVGITIDERYRVESLLGRGGMGTVYLARDITLDRDVALKVHKPGSGDLRLKREAVAMAQLAHPNVVTVFEVGAIEGATYVAMEYVRGATLRAWLAADKRSWRAVVELLADAGRGLAAAHAAGLVHRDFKPENVLVGGDGRPRVGDFGLARVDPAEVAMPSLDGSIETTLTGTLLGTPAYMAPEQFASADVDARCDQFAFAIVAWEALYGRRPFEGSTIAAVREAIDRHELVAPRSPVPDRVRRVLERGLAKRPADRYRDMPAMLADLRRAAAPRFWRRAGAAAGIAGALAVGGALLHGRTAAADPCESVALAGWDAPRRLGVEAAFLATGVPYAEAAWGRTQHGLDDFAQRWRAQGRATCAAEHSDDATLHARRQSCLEQSKLAFDAVIGRLGDATTDRALAAQTLQLADVLPDVDVCARPDGFEVATGEQLAIFGELARAQSLIWAGKLDDAERILASVHEPGSKRAKARMFYMTGHIAQVRGHHADAVKLYESALYAAEAAGYDELVAVAAGEILHVLGNEARDADAQRYRELALAAAERVGTPTAKSRVARDIGHADVVAGRFEAGERELQSALEIARSRVPADDFDVATILTDIGDLYYRRGQAVKAEPVQREAIDRFARVLGTMHPANADAYNNYGNTLADLGRSDEATAAYAKALAIAEGTLGPDSPSVARTLSNAAGLEVQAGKLADARAHLERALAIDEKTLVPTHPSIAHVVFNLGEIARLQESFADAKRFHERALDIRRKTVGDHHPSVTESELALAAVALAQHDAAAAQAACEAAKQSTAGSDANNAELAAGIDMCFGELALERKESARAVPLLEQALALQQKSEGDPGAVAEMQFALARALPASAHARALELAKSARVAFEHEGAFRRRELAETDAWLKEHP